MMISFFLEYEIIQKLGSQLSCEGMLEIPMMITKKIGEIYARFGPSYSGFFL